MQTSNALMQKNKQSTLNLCQQCALFITHTPSITNLHFRLIDFFLLILIIFWVFSFFGVCLRFSLVCVCVRACVSVCLYFCLCLWNLFWFSLLSQHSICCILIFIQLFSLQFAYNSHTRIILYFISFLCFSV